MSEESKPNTKPVESSSPSIHDKLDPDTPLFSWSAAILTITVLTALLCFGIWLTK